MSSVNDNDVDLVRFSLTTKEATKASLCNDIAVALVRFSLISKEDS